MKAHLGRTSGEEDAREREGLSAEGPKGAPSGIILFSSRRGPRTRGLPFMGTCGSRRRRYTALPSVFVVLPPSSALRLMVEDAQDSLSSPQRGPSALRLEEVRQHYSSLLFAPSCAEWSRSETFPKGGFPSPASNT
jgi:hypothetical protein